MRRRSPSRSPPPRRRSPPPRRYSRSRSRSPAARRPPPPPPPRDGGERRPPPPPPLEEKLPEVGAILRGKVVTTKPFGAFCSLDGHRAQGLCHISQLANRRVEETEDVAKVGDDVWVKVLSVEAGTGSRGGGRVSLSMKACLLYTSPSPRD